MSDNNEKELKYISPFKYQILQSFPFIAEDFDQLTEYGLYCKLVEYMNKVIDGTNTLGENVDEYIAKFNALKDYVDDYFENLDVQDEIDNKLNEMVENGDLDIILSARFSINSKYPLYYAQENATVSTITNTKNNLVVPVAPDNEERAISYGYFDNVIQLIYGATSYDNETSSGYVLPINTSNITLNTVSLLQQIESNYIKENMYVILCDSETPRNNYKYVGLVESYDSETLTITVKNGWYNYINSTPEIPENVTYAWINPVDKLYGQNFSLHVTNENVRSLVGSQCDLYGYTDENNELAIVGYSPVLRNCDGWSAFRARAENDTTWSRGLNFEGNYGNLVVHNNKSLINGNDEFGNISLQQSINQINKDISLWVSNQDIDLTSVTVNSRTFYYIYNNGSSPIKVTGQFKINSSTTINFIIVDPGEIIPIISLSSTNSYGLIKSYLNSTHINTGSSIDNTEVVLLSGTDTILSTLFPNLVNSQQTKITFINNNNNNLTLSAGTNGGIFINGNSGSSTTIKGRTSGTIIAIKNSSGYTSYYINTVQPS